MPALIFICFWLSILACRDARPFLEDRMDIPTMREGYLPQWKWALVYDL